MISSHCGTRDDDVVEALAFCETNKRENISFILRLNNGTVTIKAFKAVCSRGMDSGVIAFHLSQTQVTVDLTKSVNQLRLFA